MTILVSCREPRQKALRITDRRGQHRMAGGQPRVKYDNSRSVIGRCWCLSQVLNVHEREIWSQTDTRRKIYGANIAMVEQIFR